MSRPLRIGHYTEERLGMAERTVGQRASLESRLWELPAPRAAMKERRISYEKARLVARVARDDDSARPWIEQALEIASQTEKQACARGEMDLRVPERVAVSGLRTSPSRPPRGREPLLQVLDEVVDVLDAGGYAYEAVGDAEALARLPRLRPARATRATSARSTSFSIGFVGLSIQTSFVSLRSARSTFRGSLMSTPRESPSRRKTLSKMRNVPP
jgi:hypothetical protein